MHPFPAPLLCNVVRTVPYMQLSRRLIVSFFVDKCIERCFKISPGWCLDLGLARLQPLSYYRVMTLVRVTACGKCIVHRDAIFEAKSIRV